MFNLPKCILAVLKGLKFCLKRIYRFTWSRIEDCLHVESCFTFLVLCQDVCYMIDQELKVIKVGLYCNF